MNRTVATSLTTITFLIIGISGVMMFFKFYDMQVKELHEILGLVFMGAVVFHLFYNWKSMKSYFNKKVFLSSLVAGVLVSAAFVGTSLEQGENPKRTIIESVLKAPINSSLALFKLTNDQATNKLKKANINFDNQTTILAIAQANKTSPFKIIAILTK